MKERIVDVHSDGRRWVLPVVLSATVLPLSGVVASQIEVIDDPH